MMTNINKTVQGIEALGLNRISVDEPLCNHSTWQIGGPADILVQPETVEEISRLRSYVNQNDIPCVIIGEGSNLLFDDAGLRGIVIKIGRALSSVRIEGTVVYAQAGIAVPRLARMVGLAGLTGIEHTIGIPGTLGGLVAMNGGSQRKNLGSVIDFVEAVDSKGNITKLNSDECDFSYRKSIFQNSDWLITAAQIKLERGDRETIRREMLDNLRTRRAKFPRREPNCGSVFLSDPQAYKTIGPPGKAIEDAGLKGLRIGDAQVSKMHANFIINRGKATSVNVIELIGKIRTKVYKKNKIWLESEVRYISPEGVVIQASHLASYK